MYKALALLALLSTSASAGLLDEPDKRTHVQASIAVTAVFYAYNEYNNNSHWQTVGECMLVGVGKELYDEYDYGGFDTRDLAADAIGCVSGIFLIDTGWKFVASDSNVGIKYEYKF